jgi:hypothetical protein
MLGAAKCAAHDQAPLLFTAPNPRENLVREAIKRLKGERRARDFLVPVKRLGDVKRCLIGVVHHSSRWSRLMLPSRPLVFPGFKHREKLAPVVVFAARKAPRAPPDVAIGLALAAHMAEQRRTEKKADREVSLVVLPRYLEADPKLEDLLRSRHELVKSGLLLGQTGILSDDTRTLLRQLLVSADERGFLAGLRGNLGDVEPLLAALLALLTVAPTVRAISDETRVTTDGGASQEGGNDRPDGPPPPKPEDQVSPVPPKQKKRGRMKLRLWLSLLGAAVVIYGCVLAWRTHAVIVLVIGAALLLLALVWEKLLAPESIERTAVAQHFSKGQEIVLQLITSPPLSTRPIGCLVDGPGRERFYSDRLEQDRGTRSLTYTARFPRDFERAEALKEGTYVVRWFELRDDSTLVVEIAGEGFSCVVLPPPEPTVSPSSSSG